ncbi:glycosyltransferase family 4 protein [Myxococcota bacterium]|nr:glycosyltransferase family 4 protein [Myxococcota bacterium]
MRLALVYDAVYPWVRGGGEAHNHELARRLAARGHQVHLVGMKWWDGPRTREQDGVVLHGISPRAALYGAHGQRRIAPPVTFGAAATAFLLRHRFDLVDVCAFPYFAALGGRLSLARRPWTVTWFEVWGDYWRQYLGRAGVIGQAVERSVARGCAFHVAHSPLTAARLRALVPGIDVQLIPSGIDLEPPAVAPPRDAQRLAWCGRAVDYKNLPALLRALAGLPGAWHLDVVGDGPALAGWQQLAGELGLGARVTWHGFLPERSQVHALLSTCGIYVQTSQREGMGKAALEAAGLGCAVVCVAHPEVATTGFFHDGVDARIVPGEAAALRQAVAGLLAEPARARDLAAAGRQAALALSWERVTDRVEAHYRRVLAARPPA